MNCNQTESKTTIVVKSNYGNYQWCCGGCDQAGFYLDATPNFSGIFCGQMINIKIIIHDSNLLDNIDIIEIKTINNELLKHTYSKINKITVFYFGINEKYAGLSIKINFSKIKPLPENTRFMRRPDIEIIHQEIIDFPILDIKSSVECPICLEQITNNKYISHCKHVFHIKCLWDYLKINNYLRELSWFCSKHCKHDKKTNPFPCPLCRTILESNY
ncbi:hypothetical protein ma27 [Moumouvirus australiensis]|uniref:RING-type domain-containing protein n=1 Tax=Moumouvirus australiensis TaxID=2109587 RepID=A0A2P1EKK3_9VIRU|nr:hypothetical protein QKC55_gp876 [Moumouvirus australiensis]AVL94414.1 hypothetical protein ma27 [Moumouvirus australiensis]